SARWMASFAKMAASDAEDSAADALALASRLCRLANQPMTPVKMRAIVPPTEVQSPTPALWSSIILRSFVLLTSCAAKCRGEDFRGATGPCTDASLRPDRMAARADASTTAAAPPRQPERRHAQAGDRRPAMSAQHLGPAQSTRRVRASGQDGRFRRARTGFRARTARDRGQARCRTAVDEQAAIPEVQ